MKDLVGAYPVRFSMAVFVPLSMVPSPGPKTTSLPIFFSVPTWISLWSLSRWLDKLRNEILLYRNRLVGLRNKAIPEGFGAFVIRGSRAAVETMCQCSGEV